MQPKSRGRVAVITLFTTAISLAIGPSVARAAGVDGTPDADFAAAFSQPFNSEVNAVAVQSDGSIVVGGDFSGTVARFGAAGVPDISFNALAGGVTGGARITSLSVGQSGEIVAAGWFTGLYRFSSAGAPDPAFAAASISALGGETGAVVVQPDGQILVVGSFAGILARLNPDGTADAAFNANVAATLDARAYSVALQSDGKILVAGEFTGHLKRFLASGAPDTTFNNNVGDAGGTVSIVRVATDGSVVIVGEFGDRLARYHSDGTADTGFNAHVHAVGIEEVGMYALAIQRDGKVVIGGDTTTHLARFNADGTADTAFNSTVGSYFDNRVWAITVDASDNLLVGGNFTSRVARLSSSYAPASYAPDLPATGVSTDDARGWRGARCRPAPHSPRSVTVGEIGQIRVVGDGRARCGYSRWRRVVHHGSADGGLEYGPMLLDRPALRARQQRASVQGERVVDPAFAKRDQGIEVVGPALFGQSVGAAQQHVAEVTS